MIKGVIVKKLEKYEDARGWLSEIFRDDEIATKPVMAYVSSTKPGIARGPHEHKFQTDIFVFLGPGTVELKLWKGQEEMKMEVGENNPTMIIVPPGVVHAYKCISETPAWCINLPDKLYKGVGKKEEVDEIRWENDPNSPYKI